MASPEIHAKCGASNAHRYLVCTASPTFEAQFPASTSVYAEEGTLAHSICELFVKTRGDVDAMAEELRPLQRNKLYQPEMLTCAKVYCDWIMEKALGYTNPPAIMTETCLFRRPECPLKPRSFRARPRKNGKFVSPSGIGTGTGRTPSVSPRPTRRPWTGRRRTGRTWNPGFPRRPPCGSTFRRSRSGRRTRSSVASS